jgi:sugar (pentulose or hexulose) kinase
MRQAQIPSASIAAVAATSQREGIAILDAQGKTLFIGPNSDTRAFFEGQAIDEERGAEVYRVTGHTPSLLFAPAKLRWFREHQPKLAERAATVLSLDAWLAFQLSGARAIEAAAAAELGLADISTRSLAQNLLDSLGVPRITPPFVQSGESIGGVHPAAAKAAGLKAGTPVIAAGSDTQCALLGMGATGPGAIGIVAGTTAPAQMALDTPVFDEKTRTWSGLHCLNDRWVLESNASDAGAAYAWLVSMLFGSADRANFSRAEELAKKAPARSGTVAFIGPQAADMGNIGPKMGGMLFPLPLSIGGADRGRLLRAAKENLAFAIRANIELLEGVVGRQAGRIAIGGGMTQSALLCRIITDVANRELTVSQETEVAALGAAIGAAAGAGYYPSVRAAAGAMASQQKRLKPDALEAMEYAEAYEKWKGLAQGLDGLSSFL